MLLRLVARADSYIFQLLQPAAINFKKSTREIKALYSKQGTILERLSQNMEMKFNSVSHLNLMWPSFADVTLQKLNF
jgi:hypothetical protein